MQEFLIVAKEFLLLVWNKIEPEAISFGKYVLSTVITLLLAKLSLHFLFRKGLNFVMSHIPWSPVRSLAWALVRTVAKKDWSGDIKFKTVFSEIKAKYPWFPSEVIEGIIESEYQQFRAELIKDDK